MVHIAQTTAHDLPAVRSLFLEYIEWLIPIVETVWEYHIDITPVEAVERDMADIQQFMPPDGRPIQPIRSTLLTLSAFSPQNSAFGSTPIV